MVVRSFCFDGQVIMRRAMFGGSDGLLRCHLVGESIRPDLSTCQIVFVSVVRAIVTGLFSSVLSSPAFSVVPISS